MPSPRATTSFASNFRSSFPHSEYDFFFSKFSSKVKKKAIEDTPKSVSKREMRECFRNRCDSERNKNKTKQNRGPNLFFPLRDFVTGKIIKNYCKLVLLYVTRRKLRKKHTKHKHTRLYFIYNFLQVIICSPILFYFFKQLTIQIKRKEPQTSL